MEFLGFDKIQTEYLNRAFTFTPRFVIVSLSEYWA